MKLKHRDNCVLVKFIPDRDEAYGSFDEESGKIYISSRLSLLGRECIYLHELQHKKCFLKKCKCWKSDYWCEYHAMRGELNGVIASGSSRMKKAYLKSMKKSLVKYQANPKLWKAHLAALKRVMKTKAFLSIVSFKEIMGG